MHLMITGLYRESKYVYDPWFVLDIQYNPGVINVSKILGTTQGSSCAFYPDTYTYDPRVVSNIFTYSYSDYFAQRTF